MVNQESNKTKARFLVYLIAFLYAVYFALPLYLESSLLKNFVSTKTVGLFFISSALLSLALLGPATKILNRFGNFRTSISLIVLSEIIILLTALFIASPLVLLLIPLRQTLVNILFVNINILLEDFSKNSVTGGIRGSFLSLMNFGILLAPILGGLAYNLGEFAGLYLGAGLIGLPIIFLFLFGFKKYKDPVYAELSFGSALHFILNHRGERLSTALQLLLEIFYATMVIYLVPYLHALGFSYEKILSVALPIILLPFILIPFWAGRIADTKFGEKKLLTIGFLILGFATAYFATTSIKSFGFLVSILFFTRIGAALIETMIESYFFKQIKSKDAGAIALFRNTRGLAYIITPIVGSLILINYQTPAVFGFLAVALIFFGLMITLRLKQN